MQNELYVGPFSELFELSFLTRLCSDLKSDPLRPRVVLVGSNLLGIHLRHALTLMAGGHASVRFVTFVDLAKHLAESSLIESGRRLFPEDVEELLIEQLVADLPEDHRFFSLAQQEGFWKALKSTFHDLIDGGITELPKTSGKLKDVAELFHQHRKQYIKLFATTSDFILESSSLADRFLGQFGTNELYCYGFSDFTGVQKLLLQNLSKTVQILAWLPQSKLSPTLFQKTLRFYQSMEVVEHKIQASPSPLIEGESAPTEYEEAEEVVRKILERISKNPRPLYRHAILLPSKTPYSNYFTDVLKRAHIPYYQEGGESFAQHRLGKAAQLLLKNIDAEWDRQSLITFLTLLPLSASKTKGIGSSGDWDLWTRQANTTRNLDAMAKRIRLRSKEGDDSFKLFSRFIDTFTRDLSTLSKPFSNWSSIGEALGHFFKDYAEENSLLEAQPFIDLLSHLKEMDTFGFSPTPSRVRKLLTSRISKLSISRNQIFEKEGVYLGTLSSARCLPFDFIAIPGLAERHYPPPFKPDPLLLDFERKDIQSGSRYSLTLKEDRLRDERALFELLQSQARDSVLLTYSRFSADGGKERSPSSFFTQSVPPKSIRHRSIAAWNQDHKRPLLDHLDWFSREVSSRMVKAPKNINTWISQSFPLALTVDTWIQNRLGSPYWTIHDGMVDPKKLPEAHTFLSATDITRYAKCPYQFFLSSVLRLKKLDLPEDVSLIRPLDRGILIHRILFLLFSALKKENALPFNAKDTTSIHTRLDAVAADVFKDAEERLPLGHQLIWETEKSFLISDLHALVEREFSSDSEFVPFDFEVRFGGRKRDESEGELSTNQSLEIKIGSSTLHLNGQIDRIDLSKDRNRARIIDYKTGNVNRSKDDSFEGGIQMQLPIYLHALSMLLPSVPIDGSDAFLLSTSYGQGFQEVSFSGAILKARKSEFLQILKTVADGIAHGHFIPIPGDQMKNCEHCDFSNVCSRNISRVFERKEKDSTLQPILSLSEIK